MIVLRRRQGKQVADWRRNGCPIPPPEAVKQKIVAAYARRFGISTLIETGTFLGEMVEASRNIFKQIYSIELDKTLFRQAQERFKKFPHITILQGDSGTVLPQLLENITSPCLFWLDAHYSGGSTAKGVRETPILQETAAILSNICQKHVVLIDDARCFVRGERDYPTIVVLRSLFATGRRHWAFSVQDDIIRVSPE